MTFKRLTPDMMERAIHAANARTSPNLILPDEKEVPLVLYAMRQLIGDAVAAQAEAMQFRDEICAFYKINPNTRLFSWEPKPLEPDPV